MSVTEMRLCWVIPDASHYHLARMVGVSVEAGIANSVLLEVTSVGEFPEFNASTHGSEDVHASKVEQWGLVVNEAMAAGLPSSHIR